MLHAFACMFYIATSHVYVVGGQYEEYPEYEYDYTQRSREVNDLPPGYMIDIEGDDVMLESQSGFLIGRRQKVKHDAGTVIIPQYDS